MSSYTISKEWNAELFFEVCSKIEGHFDNIVKHKPFYDFLSKPTGLVYHHTRRVCIKMSA